MGNEDKERNLNRAIESLQVDVNALQIKVAALESLLLDEKLRDQYLQLVQEQAEIVQRERQSGRPPGNESLPDTNDE